MSSRKPCHPLSGTLCVPDTHVPVPRPAQRCGDRLGGWQLTADDSRGLRPHEVSNTRDRRGDANEGTCGPASVPATSAERTFHRVPLWAGEGTAPPRWGQAQRVVSAVAQAAPVGAEAPAGGPSSRSESPGRAVVAPTGPRPRP